MLVLDRARFSPEFFPEKSTATSNMWWYCFLYNLLEKPKGKTHLNPWQWQNKKAEKVEGVSNNYQHVT